MTQCFLVSGADQDATFLAGLPDDVRGFAQRWIPPVENLDEDNYFGIIDDLWRGYSANERIDVWFSPLGP